MFEEFPDDTLFAQMLTIAAELDQSLDKFIHPLAPAFQHLHRRRLSKI